MGLLEACNTLTLSVVSEACLLCGNCSDGLCWSNLDVVLFETALWLNSLSSLAYTSKYDHHIILVK